MLSLILLCWWAKDNFSLRWTIKLYNTIQVAIDTILTWRRKHDIVCVYVCENIKYKKIHCYIFFVSDVNKPDMHKQTRHARTFTEWVKETLHSPCVVILLVTLFLWLSGRALHLQCRWLCVQFTGNTHTDIKCIAWMLCKSLWIKASAKFINVNVTRASEDSLSTSQHFAVSLGTLNEGYQQSGTVCYCGTIHNFWQWKQT